MEKKGLDYYRKRLNAEKQELLKTMEGFEAQGIHENMNEVAGELSAYDQHPADYGSQLFEREKDLGLLENLENQLHLVIHALDRIEEGNYGICEHCQKKIDPARLDALPYAVLCVDCKKEEEGRLTVDSGTQHDSFDLSFRDDDEFAGFDGEDAWDQLADFGTANTIQDRSQLEKEVEEEFNDL